MRKKLPSHLGDERISASQFRKSVRAVAASLRGDEVTLVQQTLEQVQALSPVLLDRLDSIQQSQEEVKKSQEAMQLLFEERMRELSEVVRDHKRPRLDAAAASLESGVTHHGSRMDLELNDGDGKL